jgi:hypothetical protein
MTQRSLSVARVLGVVILLAAWAATTQAQTQGGISGLVTDSSGAPVPGATVTVTNTATRGTRNTTTNEVEPPTKFAYPPLPWNSARIRFEIREKEVDGVKTKALTKTIENKLFQRGQVFFGSPDLKNYTVEADVLSEGNRRKMSEVGLINQRYAIILKGNAQELEVNSNQERVKADVPFKWSPNAWYHLKARVDVATDGSGVVRAKAWKKGEAEPAAWTIEVPHQKAHAHGSPGVFGFSPTDMRVCIDNVKVTAN